MKIVSRLTLKAPVFLGLLRYVSTLKDMLPSAGLLHRPASGSTVLELSIRTFGLWGVMATHGDAHTGVGQRSYRQSQSAGNLLTQPSLPRRMHSSTAMHKAKDMASHSWRCHWTVTVIVYPSRSQGQCPGKCGADAPAPINVSCAGEGACSWRGALRSPCVMGSYHGFLRAWPT